MSPSVSVVSLNGRIGYIPFVNSAAAVSDDPRICYPQAAMRLFGVFSGLQMCKFTMRKREKKWGAGRISEFSDLML